MSVELILGAIGLILGPYAGIRVGMNGTKEAVRRIESEQRDGFQRIEGKMDGIAVEVSHIRERTSVLETRMGAEERRP